jgi:TonB-linked SusC/RagA family outer membrane protein
MKKIFFYFLLSSFFGDAMAQISGSIKTAGTGIPMPGVSVKARQAGTFTVTDNEGFFTLSANSTDTLEISSAGYFPVRLLLHGRSFPLQLELTRDTKNLEEVTVNTGYQRIPKERLTGAVTSIGDRLFNEQAGTNILDRLEAITNGLYFDRQTGGTGAKILIRGLSTIQGPRAPLIILDDFPYEGDLGNINPNDVESITVLKDAAAASIWGTRAGNGVIVITTKKGRYQQPIKVEFNSNALITDKPALQDIKDISPQDYVGVEKFLYSNGFFDAQLNGEPWLAVSPVVDLLQQRDQGKISATDADAAISALSQHSFRNELNKYIYQKGINLQEALNVQGGSRNMAWNLSGGWDKNKDVLDAGYQRYHFNSGQRFHLTKNLELSTGIDYTQTETTSGKPGYGNLRPVLGSYPVYTQLANADGNSIAVFKQYRRSYIDSASMGKLPDWNYYPLTDYKSTVSSVRTQAILASIGASYSFKHFKIDLKYRYGKQSGNTQTLYGTDSYFTRNLINSFSSTDPDTGLPIYPIPLGAIRDDGNVTVESQTFRGQLSYSKRIGRHDLSAIAGNEYEAVNTDGASNRVYGYSPSTLGTIPVDYITMFPNFLSGDQQTIQEVSDFSGMKNRNVSYFGNVSDTWKEKYTLYLSARRDASNLFGATQNNRRTPLWSAGMAWAVSKESFYTSTMVPELKFRASYGKSGNSDPLRSAVTTLLYLGNSPYTLLPIARISQFANPDLSWEQVTMLNTEADFSTANHRISGSVDYYYKRASNLFGTSPVDYTNLPFNAITKNVASIAGHGWDILVNSNNIMGAFSWTTQLNINFNRDKVLQYYQPDKTASNFTLGSAVSAIEGRPVYALYDYKFAGLDPMTGDPQGYFNGAVSKDYQAITGTGTLVTDLHYIGPTLPTMVASIGNTFRFKQISLTVRVTGKFGNYFQRPSIDYWNLFLNRIGHPDYAVRWQKPGDEMHTTVPSMIYPLNTDRENFYSQSDVLATKADFIRLQYITFGYDFAKPRISCYLNINNLGLLWRANHYGIDPEYNNILPPALNFAVGIRATF